MKPLAELINAVTTRPEMFVLGASFDSVAAYISGYDQAVQENTGLGRYKTELGRFWVWLIENVAEPKGMAGNLPWESYIGPGTSDPERLKMLQQLFKEFVASTSIS
jgi:hypothetical protein